MELKPKPPTFRRMMIGLAIVFGGYGGMMLHHHDLNNGLWSCAVCFALVLGLLPSWLTGHTIVEHTGKPEKYSLLGE